MTFRDREKERLIPLKPKLFSRNACIPGKYKGKTYGFCLFNDFAEENLHKSIRDQSIGYFRDRKMDWHDGVSVNNLPLPSNHLCCSQSAAVNTWYPFVEEAEKLKNVLKDIGFSVKKVLPMIADKPISDQRYPNVSFEWIGVHNYLHELKLGRVADCWERTRGANFTSADFAFRFLRDDGKIQVILGEWKYTECYTVGKSIRVAKSGRDRLDIYGPYLKASHGLFRAKLNFDHLFYDPFDQMMRLQLLANAMEKHHEMGAEIVSVLHIAPRANTDLVNQITSEKLASDGDTIYDAWQSLLAKKGRFTHFYFENLLPIVAKHAANSSWADWMKLRYGGMK